MYSRPTEHLKRKINIPDNYSGNAFKKHGEDRDIISSPNYRDLSPTVRNPSQIPSGPQLSQQSRSDTDFEDLKETDSFDSIENSSYTPDTGTSDQQSKIPTSSPFASVLPSFSASSNHFPFGHGIGSEELLILAMMMLVYMSDDKPDNEFLLILGLLLFAG